MEEIRIERLTEDHFHLHSLDSFIRHQIVKECWRKVDGQWVLLPIAFVEEWSLEKCREEAAEIIRHQHGKMVDYGAFQGGKSAWIYNHWDRKNRNGKTVCPAGCLSGIGAVQRDGRWKKALREGH